MLLWSLCSSSRIGNSYLIRGRRSSLIVDCGSTNRHLKMALASAEISLADVRGCVLSHSHPDHTRSVCYLERCGVEVYARPETRQALIESGRTRGGVTPVADHSVDLGEFRVNWVGAPHYSADGGSCVLVESESGSVAILTDVGSVPDESLELLRGATAVICEANHDAPRVLSGKPFEGGRWRPLWVLMQRSLGPSGHLSNQQAAQVLAQIVTDQTQAVILGHISEDYNRPDIAKAVVKKYLNQRGWKGAIEIAPPDRLMGPIDLSISVCRAVLPE